MPLTDANSDVTVSALMLNFAPDAEAVVREMARVTEAGGMVAAYVWDYGGRMDMIRAYWDAARGLGSGLPAEDTGTHLALCCPDGLDALFTECGLLHVETQAIDIEMHFVSFDDYWQPFLGGQGPAPAHAAGLSEAQRARLREALRQRFAPRGDEAPTLAARAWAVRGTVPAQPRC